MYLLDFLYRQSDFLQVNRFCSLLFKIHAFDFLSFFLFLLHSPLYTFSLLNSFLVELQETVVLWLIQPPAFSTVECGKEHLIMLNWSHIEFMSTKLRQSYWITLLSSFPHLPKQLFYSVLSFLNPSTFLLHPH